MMNKNLTLVAPRNKFFMQKNGFPKWLAAQGKYDTKVAKLGDGRVKVTTYNFADEIVKTVYATNSGRFTVMPDGATILEAETYPAKYRKFDRFGTDFGQKIEYYRKVLYFLNLNTDKSKGLKDSVLNEVLLEHNQIKLCD